MDILKRLRKHCKNSIFAIIIISLVSVPYMQCYSSSITNNQESISLCLKSFIDMNKDDWFINIVADLKSRNIIKGYPGSTLNPRKPIIIGEFIALLLRTIGYEVTIDNKVWYKNYINKALELGIIEKDDKYLYDAYLTNADAAKFICKSLKIEPSEILKSSFDDMNSGIYKNMGLQWIEAIYSEKIMIGYSCNGNRTFSPIRALLRNEAFELINNIIEYKDDPTTYKQKVNDRVKRQSIVKNYTYINYYPIENIDYPKTVKDYLQTNCHKETQKELVTDKMKYILITMGDCPTSGFFTDIRDAYITDNTLFLTIRYHYNYSVTGIAAITQPISIMELDGSFAYNEVKYTIEK